MFYGNLSNLTLTVSKSKSQSIVTIVDYVSAFGPKCLSVSYPSLGSQRVLRRRVVRLHYHVERVQLLHQR